MRASHLYLSSASHLHFPFHLSLVHLTSSPLNLSFASLIAPLTSTSDLHLLQHLSIASLSCMYHVGDASYAYFVIAMRFACSNLVVAPSIYEYKVSHAS